MKNININDIKPTSEQLCILGNGFDLAHGVQSSYYDFHKSLKKDSELLESLEVYIKKPDIWGDFENNLAYLDRASILYRFDTAFDLMDVKEEDDDDFSYASFYSAIEYTAEPAIIIESDLPIAFKKWVKKLKQADTNQKFGNILTAGAKYITFNYTEFLETCYNVPKQNILYIHGNRNIDKELILGHGQDADKIFDEWFNENENKKWAKDDPVRLAYFHDGKNLDDYRTPMRYYGFEKIVDYIEEYYENSEKKTKNVLNQHKKFFNSLKNVKQILVLGHSLSSVDYPYFEELIKNNNHSEQISWFISWHNDADIHRIKTFVQAMKINENQINLFKI